jgi:hypothetical protein
MKKLLLLSVAILLAACSTEEQIINFQSKIGDITKTPDLYIPELEAGWQYMDGGLGLRNESSYLVTKTPITNDTLVNYSCWIANKLPDNPSEYYTGQHDFVVNMAEDGIYNETSNSYNFPGMLSIITFQNGLPIGEVQKQRFYVIPTDFRQEINPYGIVLYGEEFMAIQAGTSDNYVNKAKVKNGLNLVVVEVNPDLEIRERNYTNNVSTLPLNVTLGVVNSNNILGHAVVDLSAIDNNKTIPPNNVVVTKNFQGRNKFVTIDFSCPYHEPIYVKHWFTIKKNGVIVADHIDESVYTEQVSGNYRTATYTIITTVVGLGQSTPTTITVTR